MSSIGKMTSERGGEILVYIQDASPQSRSRRRPLYLPSWSTLHDLKQNLYGLLHVPNDKQRLFYRGKELKKNNASLQSLGIYRDGETIFLVVGTRPDDHWGAVLQPHGTLVVPKVLQKVLDRARRAMDMGLVPKLAMEGTGGTYFLRDAQNRNIGCFKPHDEEPFTPNNVRGFAANFGGNVRMRSGVQPGEAFIREVAAYLLDFKHFSSVPATCLVESKHHAYSYSSGKVKLKHGSFQEFVVHDDLVADLSTSLYSTEQVHKIAILDIRLLNGDRNDANILVRRKKKGYRGRKHTGTSVKDNSRNDHNERDYLELIPIDHGYCLPDKIEIGWCDWCWLDWPQLKEPLGREALDLIESLDPEKDADILRNKLTLDDACFENMRISEMLLKLGVEHGLTLFDIANIVVRQNLDKPSELEQIRDHAKELAFMAMQNNMLPVSRHASYLGKPVLNRMKTICTGNGGHNNSSNLSPNAPRISRISRVKSRIPELDTISHHNLSSEYENKNSHLHLISAIQPNNNLLAPKHKSVATRRTKSVMIDISSKRSNSPSPVKSRRNKSMFNNNDDSFSPRSPCGFWREDFDEMEMKARANLYNDDAINWDDSDSRSETSNDSNHHDSKPTNNDHQSECVQLELTFPVCGTSASNENCDLTRGVHCNGDFSHIRHESADSSVGNSSVVIHEEEDYHSINGNNNESINGSKSVSFQDKHIGLDSDFQWQRNTEDENNSSSGNNSKSEHPVDNTDSENASNEESEISSTGEGGVDDDDDIFGEHTSLEDTGLSGSVGIDSYGNSNCNRNLFLSDENNYDTNSNQHQHSKLSSPPTATVGNQNISEHIHLSSRPGLVRVNSFNGIASPALYDLNTCAEMKNYKKPVHGFDSPSPSAGSKFAKKRRSTYINNLNFANGNSKLHRSAEYTEYFFRLTELLLRELLARKVKIIQQQNENESLLEGC